MLDGSMQEVDDKIRRHAMQNPFNAGKEETLCV
jgi:hypothetical protein